MTPDPQLGKLESINTSVYLTEYNHYILFYFSRQDLNEHHHSVLFWAPIQAHLWYSWFWSRPVNHILTICSSFRLQASFWFPFLVRNAWVISFGNMTNPNQSFSPNYIETGILRWFVVFMLVLPFTSLSLKKKSPNTKLIGGTQCSLSSTVEPGFLLTCSGCAIKTVRPASSPGLWVHDFQSWMARVSQGRILADIIREGVILTPFAHRGSQEFTERKWKEGGFTVWGCAVWMT